MGTKTKFFGVLIMLSYLTPIASQNLKITNGFWFNGTDFDKKEVFYVKDGVFSNQEPKTVDSIIDLSGKYIIPPFAEAHTHNLSSTYGLEPILNAYLNEGTFYVQVLGCSHKARLEVLEMLKKSNSFLDASFSNGGITSSLGHPFMIYEPLAMGIYDPNQRKNRYQEIIKSRLAQNDAYWFFDSRADVDTHWDELMKTKPDVIKIMLIDAENQSKHEMDSTRIGRMGINASVARYVAKKARQEGLRLFAHIETANDFRLGLEIGVDVFGHMPGYSYGGSGDTDQYTLNAEDFKKASAQGVAITPTAYLALRRLPKEDDLEKEKALHNILSFQSDFFQQAFQNQIPMALGSDDFGETLMKEVDYLHQNGLVNNLELLQMMTINGAEICFPNRKLGQLKKDYEGSFLVLDDNPLLNFGTIKDIHLRVKQGKLLD
nr:hypothetical protein [Allomuricauda sp.]